MRGGRPTGLPQPVKEKPVMRRCYSSGLLISTTARALEAACFRTSLDSHWLGAMRRCFLTNAALLPVSWLTAGLFPLRPVKSGFAPQPAASPIAPFLVCLFVLSETRLYFCHPTPQGNVTCYFTTRLLFVSLCLSPRVPGCVAVAGTTAHAAPSTESQKRKRFC